jgi:hypothetical protein
MNLQRRSIILFIPFLFLIGCFFAIETVSAADHGAIAAIEFPPDLQSYGDEGPVTTLVGMAPDQAALAGVLETIYEAHFTLLSVEML